MQNHHVIPGSDIARWLAPFGLSVRLFFSCLSWSAIRQVRRDEFQTFCNWLGKRSFHFVALSAVFVSIALTIQSVVELQKYRAEDISGAVIAIGLLREFGPLTVSLAWCARVAALVSDEARLYGYDNVGDFARDFVCPRYLAALSMSIPLGAYGLVFGFVTAALVAPLLGVSSTNDFSGICKKRNSKSRSIRLLLQANFDQSNNRHFCWMRGRIYGSRKYECTGCRKRCHRNLVGWICR